MTDGGSGYAIGGTVSIGAGVDGWEEPAVFTVTEVDANGGITTVSLVSGGKFNGVGTGDYNLDHHSLSLLMRATASVHESEENTANVGQSTIAAAASAGLLALVAGVMLMKRRAMTRPVGEASGPMQEASQVVQESTVPLTPDYL
jgi:hypothetical protein